MQLHKFFRINLQSITVGKKQEYKISKIILTSPLTEKEKKIIIAYNFNNVCSRYARTSC